jgi:excisionase family DNA binding protein
MAGSTIPEGLGQAEPQDVLERLTQSERLLTAKELAELLAVSPKTLYSYVSRNMIPHFKIEANVRFRGKDVAEWLRRRAACAFRLNIVFWESSATTSTPLSTALRD